MTVLLDSNVLIALAVDDHQHHAAAQRWLAALDEALATCPITQGTLLRMLIRQGAPADQAIRVLAAVTDDERHEFWPDDLPYSRISRAGVFGPRQVTDAYLAALARHRAGRLATFDRALAGAHADVRELAPC